MLVEPPLSSPVDKDVKSLNICVGTLLEMVEDLRKNHEAFKEEVLKRLKTLGGRVEIAHINICDLVEDASRKRKSKLPAVVAISRPLVLGNIANRADSWWDTGYNLTRQNCADIMKYIETLEKGL
jgi:hypothetical protein